MDPGTAPATAPRAVLVAPVVPAPTGNGLAMRAGMWLEALSRRFATDALVVPMFPVHASAVPFAQERAAFLTALTGRRNEDPSLPRTVPVMDDAALALFAERVAGADLVVVFRLYLAQFATLAREAGAAVLLDADDLDWVREERLGQDHEARAYRAWEARMRGCAHVGTTAAAADARDMAAVDAGTAWRHVPNGVRAPEPPAPNDAAADIDLLFVATLGYEPNADAATWLVQDVLPLLPGVRCAIVGAGVPPHVARLAGPDVVVASDVADVAPWYARSRACVVPIHAGSGTRTKIPEAWAHGRPVVSTTIGAEGLDAGGTVLIADDAAGFAAHCRALLADAALRRQLAEAGRTRYAASHSLDIAIAAAGDAADLAIAAARGTGH